MTFLYYLIIFIVGLSVGSFLNAVIWRLHTQEGFLRGRSYCPKCRASIRAKDLVPLLSYVLLRGRCRDCGKTISWQYPIVEAVTGLAFCLLFWRFGWEEAFFVYAVETAFLIVVFTFDLKHYLILDRVMLPAALVGLAGSLILGIKPADLLLGAGMGAGFFFMQYALSRGKWIGGGDIRLGAVMGLMLGWDKLLVALFLSYFIGSLVGAVLVASGKKGWQSRLPFGVFLTLATYLAFLWGSEIVAWYRLLLR